jgi:hypothetical protein
MSTTVRTDMQSRALHLAAFVVAGLLALVGCSGDEEIGSRSAVTSRTLSATPGSTTTPSPAPTSVDRTTAAALINKLAVTGRLAGLRADPTAKKRVKAFPDDKTVCDKPVKPDTGLESVDKRIMVFVGKSQAYENLIEVHQLSSVYPTAASSAQAVEQAFDVLEGCSVNKSADGNN